MSAYPEKDAYRGIRLLDTDYSSNKVALKPKRVSRFFGSCSGLGLSFEKGVDAQPLKVLLLDTCKVPFEASTEWQYLFFALSVNPRGGWIPKEAILG